MRNYHSQSLTPLNPLALSSNGLTIVFGTLGVVVSILQLGIMLIQRRSSRLTGMESICHWSLWRSAQFGHTQRLTTLPRSW